MRIVWSQRLTSLASLILVLAIGVQCEDKKEKDPMLAEESGNYLTGVSYANNPTAVNSYLALLKRSSASSANLDTSKLISPRASSAAFFTKPSSTLNSAESGEVYKKAASEPYSWGSNEVPDHGESLEEQSDYGYGQQQQQQQHQQQQSHGYLNGPEMMYQKGKEISITPDHKPITLHYRTHSQPIVVHQTRIPGPKPEVKHTTSHEEPHRVVHEVVRPIIQEVHEIIQPYRRVTQEVRPVLEEVKTVVAKDAGKGGMGMGGGGAYGRNGALVYSGAGGGMVSGESKHMYRKAALYEVQQSPSEAFSSMALPPSMTAGKRSKVFLRKGVPVYQSNYMGPAFVRS